MRKKERFKRWLEKRVPLHGYTSPHEEKWNGITHAIGVGLSFVALFLILCAVPSFRSGKGGMLIFAFTMILLYAVSAAYHLVRFPTVKRILRVLDHISIYLLIAGTYTPIMLSLRTDTAIAALVLQWSLVVVGISLSVIFWQRFKAFRVILYLVMGWCVIFVAWRDLRAMVPPGFLSWILAGGISYTTGIFFFVAKKLLFHHAIWHLFVLGGTILHFVGIYRHLVFR